MTKESWIFDFASRIVRTAEFLQRKNFIIRNFLFDIVLRTPHPAGGSPVSIFSTPSNLIIFSNQNSWPLRDQGSGE
jgi:hypothetical protein